MNQRFVRYDLNEVDAAMHALRRIGVGTDTTPEPGSLTARAQHPKAQSQRGRPDPGATPDGVPEEVSA